MRALPSDKMMKKRYTAAGSHVLSGGHANSVLGPGRGQPHEVEQDQAGCGRREVASPPSVSNHSR